MKYEAYGYSKDGVVRSGIAAARYQEMKQAKATCFLALDLEEKFALLIDNYAEFEFELLRLAESYLIWSVGAHADSMQSRLCLDRRLVNLLTSCRLYLDQSEHGISGLYGNPSPELASVKAFRRKLYDGHWGYRLMEALRNHAQHSGLLVHAISYPQFTSMGQGPDYGEFAISPLSIVSTLAEDSDFKKTILKEMQAKGKQIDLRAPTREYLTCLVELHDELRALIQPRLESARNQYEKAVKEFSVIGKQVVQVVSLLELDDDDKKGGSVALVTEFLDYYDRLRKRNIVSKKLEYSTASNTDQKRECFPKVR